MVFLDARKHLAAFCRAQMKSPDRAALASLLALALLASASGATFEGLLLGFETDASAVSADGSTVVGGYSITNGGSHGYRWTPCGVIGLGDLPNTGITNAYDVSGDGSVVVGFSGGDAFRWAPGTCIIGLGLSSPAVATVVSDDGTVILGYGRLNGQFSQQQAFMKIGNGPVAAFDFPDIIDIFAVSRDNSIVVGGAGSAYRWNASTGAIQLPDLDPNFYQTSTAFDISADGTVIVGTSVKNVGTSTNPSGEVHLVTWTGPNNTITDLGALDSTNGTGASADATNADGSIIVGEAVDRTGSEPVAYAFIWDATNGIRNLQDVLTNNYGLGSQLSGWQLTDATGISDDGNVIAGNGVYTDSSLNSTDEAWRVIFGGRPLSLCSAASRANQNGTSYDISLICGVAVTPTSPQKQATASAGSQSSQIECRSGDGSGNGNYTVVLTFSNSLSSVGGASASESGCGTIGVSNTTISGSDYIVNLTGVCNAQYVTVTLTNVNDSTGGHLDTLTGPPMGVLIGDTNGDGFVNSADISQTKSQSGQAVGSSNFREDLNADGFINSADISLVKSKSGTALPPPPTMAASSRQQRPHGPQRSR